MFRTRRLEPGEAVDEDLAVRGWYEWIAPNSAGKLQDVIQFPDGHIAVVECWRLAFADKRNELISAIEKIKANEAAYTDWTECGLDLVECLTGGEMKPGSMKRTTPDDLRRAAANHRRLAESGYDVVFHMRMCQQRMEDAIALQELQNGPANIEAPVPADEHAALPGQVSHAPAIDKPADGGAKGKLEKADHSLPLDSEDLAILRALKKAGALQSQYDLETVTHLSRKTIGNRLQKLREVGLTHRPKGERGGEGITELGLKRLEVLERN
jgi:hypothetical protein